MLLSPLRVVYKNGEFLQEASISSHQTIHTGATMNRIHMTYCSIWIKDVRIVPIHQPTNPPANPAPI